MKKIKAFSLLTALTVSIQLLTVADSQAHSQEAQRYFDRGMAAVEMANSPNDYVPAINEFKQAISLAPDWPDAYYNLGMVQEKAGKHADAIASLRQYLRLAPDADDAATVTKLVNKLEYKAEQEVTKEDALEIFGSLSDKTKWQLVNGSPMYMNWVRGLRIKGEEVFINWISDLRNQTTQSDGILMESGPEGKIFSLEYTIGFSNFCSQPNICDAGARYVFAIVSKRKVHVRAVEYTPKGVKEEWKKYEFDYVSL